MAPPRRDSRIESWQRRLDESIRPEVVGMFHHRYVYRTVAEIINRHGELPPSSFFDLIRDTYAITQSVAVRRQAERSPRVISLGSLLDEISRDAVRLTREWYLTLYDADDQHYATRSWDRGWFAGPAGHVDPDAIRGDLALLTQESERVRDYVDRHLAHYDRDPLAELPTFEDLNAAVDAIGDLFRKYNALLRAGSWPTLVPIAQYNWLAPFLEPWIRDEALLFEIMGRRPEDA
jgi:hypothetical protein